MKITIYGTPIAKKRPRFVRRGKFVSTYSPQETEEGKWLLMAKGQVSHTIPKETPIDMRLRFLFQRPKGHFGSGRNAGILKQSAPRQHTQKPDVDNLQKFVKDCLNGVAYHDDSQICHVEASKVWLGNPLSAPRTEIEIEVLE